MKSTCKICWSLSALLLIAIAAMGYMFLVRGSVVESDDGRTAIRLNAGERDLVLMEMRTFLESIQGITAALAENDMKAVSDNARKVGMANANEVPVTLMGKLPLEFKTLGLSTHEAFDALAMEATDMGDANVVLSKLGELMINCTSCHAGYRIDVESSARKEVN